MVSLHCVYVNVLLDWLLVWKTFDIWNIGKVSLLYETSSVIVKLKDVHKFFHICGKSYLGPVLLQVGKANLDANKDMSLTVKIAWVGW